MQQIILVATKYTDWCITNNLLAFPASYRSVAEFICYSVEELEGSTKSVANKVSALKMFSYYLNEPWLSESDLYRLKNVRKRLALEDIVPVNRKAPLFMYMIIDFITCFLDVKSSLLDMLQATVLLTAHNGLLRSGDFLTAQYALQAKDVQWDHSARSVVLHLGPTKAHQLGTGEKVRITDFAGLSAYKFLLNWYNRHDLGSRPNYYLFPMPIHSAGKVVAMDFSQPASKKWFSNVIDKCVRSLGLDASSYSGHSLRAGGATELFNARVAYPMIKLYGRWKSDAALIYYRDDIEVSHIVADAFGTSSKGKQSTK